MDSENVQWSETEIIPIYSRLYWMPFPSTQTIKALSLSIKSICGKNSYYIWNLSEHLYDTTHFDSQVAELPFAGYPCPPLKHIFMTCQAILKWLNTDPSNIAFIHCQSNKGRSAVIISSVLNLLQIFKDPLEAVAYFSSKVALNNQLELFNSQSRSISNFYRFMSGEELNRKSYRLEKIIMSGTLNYSDKATKEILRPYIQIFNGSTAIFNGLENESLQNFSPDDGAICFNVGIEVNDEILIRCRHYKSEEERVPIFRALFNPIFASSDVIRITDKEMDLSPQFVSSKDFLVDLMFRPTDKQNQSIEIIEILKVECLSQASRFNGQHKIQTQKSNQKEEVLQKHKKDIVESKREIVKSEIKPVVKAVPEADDENELDIRNLLTSINISGGPQYEDD